MASQVSRYIDPDLMNLDGGIFDGAHLRAPADWETVPDRITPMLGEPKIVARARTRHARAMVFMFTSVTVALMAVGLAGAATQPWRPLFNSPPAQQTAAPAVPAPVQPPSTPASPAAPAAAPPQPAQETPAFEEPSFAGAQGSAAPTGAQPLKATASSPVVSPATPPTPADTSKSAPAASQPAQPDPLAALAAPNEFSRAAASIAIASAARRASFCIPADDARTTMPVRVVYATSGRVTSAALQGGPFMGTEVGSCIASALRTASIPAFDGDPTAVTTTIRVR